VVNQNVSSADVWVNGVPVLSPSDFNANVTTLDRPIRLELQNTISVELRSQPGASLVLEVVGVDNDPPTVTYTETPPPNAAGWHNGDDTVAFACSDLTSGIASCSGPTTVTAEGANQPVSGVGRDNAGNTTDVSVLVNIDRTPPAISIESPADGSQIAAMNATVSGTVADVLAGVVADSVTCNGQAAVMSGSAFSCNVALVPGHNHITVQASDRAGNIGTAGVNVTTQAPTATQHLHVLDVTPAAVPINSPTAVTVTARVDVDATLLPSTVALYQFDAQTQGVTLLTQMYDDGTHGDALKGDNVFTTIVTVNHPTPSILFLKAAASYRNLTDPVFSEPVRLFVQDTIGADQALANLATLLEQNDIAGALVYFAPSPKTTDFLTHLNAAQRDRLVALLRSLHLVSTNGDVRVYRGPWLEADGTTTEIEFGLTRDPLGRWVIFSW
jgi:hypothetical protein